MSVLYEAVVRRGKESEMGDDANSTEEYRVMQQSAKSFDAGRVAEMKALRASASELIATGAQLYDMLKQEGKHRVSFKGYVNHLICFY